MKKLFKDIKFYYDFKLKFLKVVTLEFIPDELKKKK